MSVSHLHATTFPAGNDAPLIGERVHPALCVPPIDPVVQRIKPELRFLLRFLLPLLSHKREFLRHPRDALGSAIRRFFRSRLAIPLAVAACHSPLPHWVFQVPRPFTSQDQPGHRGAPDERR
jgi:hypothetical protein